LQIADLKSARLWQPIEWSVSQRYWVNTSAQNIWCMGSMSSALAKMEKKNGEWSKMGGTHHHLRMSGESEKLAPTGSFTFCDFIDRQRQTPAIA
jgi:hypothetical protein